MADESGAGADTGAGADETDAEAFIAAEVGGAGAEAAGRTGGEGSTAECYNRIHTYHQAIGERGETSKRCKQQTTNLCIRFNFLALGSALCVVFAGSRG